MNIRGALACALFAGLLSSISCAAANPFLAAKSEAPVTAKFKGVEWNDDYGPEDYAWSARVTTQRVATAKWGAFFKITFDQIATKAPQPREVPPRYFFTTENEIVLFNEEKPEEAMVRLAAQDQPPKFAPGDIYGLSKGSRKVADNALSGSQLTVKGDRSTYEWTHNSGHFTRAIWQRGIGLIEYAQGYGARRDGFRLKRD